MMRKENVLMLAYMFVVAFCFFFFWGLEASPLSHAGLGNDTWIFKAMGRAWLDGKIPYRDLFDHKGPYMYLFQAIGLGLKMEKWGPFLLQVTNMSITLFILGKLCRLFTQKRGVLYISVFVFLLFFMSAMGVSNQTEEWSLIFVSLPLYLTVKYILLKKEHHPYVYTFIYGVCLGVISLIKVTNGCVNIGLLLGLAILFFVQGKYQMLFCHFFFFLGGMMLAWIPMVFYFAVNGALYDMIYANYIFNMEYHYCPVKVDK